MKNTWQTKEFEDCLQKVVYTTKIQRNAFLDAGTFPIISQEQDYINGYWNNKSDLFKVTTPVIIFGDHTQVLKYIDFDFVLGADGVKILQPQKFLYPKFFYYYLQSVDLKTLGYARHYRLLKELQLSYPESLPEQQRIVKILDEVFAAAAKAKENAEKNLANAAELFQSYLQSVFANPGKGWEEKKLGEITEEMMTGPFGSMLHKSDYVEDGTPVVNPQNIIDGKILPLQKTMISAKTTLRLKKYMLKKNDIVMARRGEMGRCAIVTDNEIGWLCGTGSLVIRLKNNADEKFINTYLSSDKSKEALLKASIGTTMSNLNQGILSDLAISLPPLKEQHSIVAKLDALSAETKKLEAIYKQKLSALEELKKSVLQKAFSGGL